MNYKDFSSNFEIKQLVDRDVDDILALYLSNPQYFMLCPPKPTMATIKNELSFLPNSKKYEDKYFLGYYKNEKLIAILDFIKDYPNNDTCYINFFIVHKDYQQAHFGQTIINDLSTYLKALHYKNLRLAVNVKNKIGKSFWLNNGFLTTNEKTNKIIVLNKYLTIRKIEIKDIYRLAEIIVFNHRFYYYPLFKDVNYSFNEINVERMVKQFKKKDFINHTYLYEDEIIKGFMYIKNKNIQILYVDNFFLHQHVGLSLLDYALNIKKINQVSVLKKNKDMINFYKYNNFIFSDNEGYDFYLNEPTSQMLKINVIKYEDKYLDEVTNLIKKSKIALNVDPKIDIDFQNQANYLYLALENNKVVGFLAYEKTDEATVEITDLYVYPLLKNLGIGTILLKNIENIIKKQNFNTIQVYLIEEKERWYESYHFFPKKGYKFISKNYLKKEI